MNLIKKAAYLKGLVEGMKLDKSKDEFKILQAMVDLMQNLSDEVENLKNDCSENKELIYEIDEDLGEIEKVVCNCDSLNNGKVYKKLNSNDLHECGGHCRNSHDDCDGDYKETDEYFDGDELDLDEEEGEGVETYEVLCPHCQKLISLSEKNFDEKEVVCPECGKDLEFDFDGSDDEKKLDLN